MLYYIICFGLSGRAKIVTSRDISKFLGTFLSYVFY